MEIDVDEPYLDNVSTKPIVSSLPQATSTTATAARHSRAQSPTEASASRYNPSPSQTTTASSFINSSTSNSDRLRLTLHTAQTVRELNHVLDQHRQQIDHTLVSTALVRAAKLLSGPKQPQKQQQ